MFASDAFVFFFSLSLLFFISSCMAQRDLRRVFAPSNLLRLTAKPLISDCVHGQLICFPRLFLAVWIPRCTNA